MSDIPYRDGCCDVCDLEGVLSFAIVTGIETYHCSICGGDKLLQKACGHCNGTGKDPDFDRACANCEGEGCVWEAPNGRD